MASSLAWKFWWSGHLPDHTRTTDHMLQHYDTTSRIQESNLWPSSLGKDDALPTELIPRKLTSQNLIRQTTWDSSHRTEQSKATFTFPNRNRVISTPRLNTLLCVHLEPINVIISYGPQTNSHLEAGFPLRCFQRLSIPNLATEHCPWQEQLSHQRFVHSGPLVLGANLLKIQRLQ